MRVFALIGLIGIIGGRMTAWLLKRWRPRLADAVRVSTMIFMHGVVAVLGGWGAVLLAQEGDRLRLVVALLLGLLALASAGFAGLYAWGWLKYGASGEELRPGR